MVNSTPVLAAQDSDSAPAPVEIRLLLPHEDTSAFRILNEEWITRHFVLEVKDIEILCNPRDTILRKGGRILMAYEGAQPVGCVALIPVSDRVLELSKMAVAPQCRGRGLGRRLLEAAIEQAKTMGAKSLFLGSSTKLRAAVHLYETAGFRHVPPDSIGPMPYTRADVFMQLSL